MRAELLDDYQLIDAAYQTQSGTLARALAYLSGEDRSDEGMDDPSLQLIVQHFEQFGQDYVSAFIAAVPEPTAFTLLGLAAGRLLMRRRKPG